MSHDLSAWTERWRPATLDQFIFQDDVTQLHLTSIIETKRLRHLLLSGPPGTGKTSWAMLLLKLLEIDPIDTLLINASKENSVNVFRDKITQFASVAPINSTYRVILLDEGDYITDEGQAAMRRMMEDQTSTVRYIITCNTPANFIDAILSRSQHFTFKSLPLEGVVKRVVEILEAEKVTWSEEDVLKIVEASPNDLRKIINTLDQYTSNGVLVVPDAIREDAVHEDQLLAAIRKDDWRAVRLYVEANVADRAIPRMYTLIYSMLLKSPSFEKSTVRWEQAVVTVADYLHRSSSVADQYINFAAMCIELGRIK